MGIKHFKTAEFDAAVAAAPLAMVDFWADWFQFSNTFKS